MHDRVLEVAIGRERRLFRGVDAADFEIALRAMPLMRENVRSLVSGDKVQENQTPGAV